MAAQPLRSEPDRGWTRRAMLRASAAFAGGLMMPRLAGGQTAAPDGWQTITARPDAAGPVLRVTRGEQLKARLVNALDAPTAIHWHGVRGPNAMDGVPGLTQAPVEPGASFDYRFKPPDAGTFWYHAPVTAAGQRLRGPAGVLIVAESEPVKVDRDELLLVDRLPAPAGAPARAIAVRANERVRLRIVNAAGSLLALRLDQHRAVVMAIDGQPAEPFAARESRLFLGPGNRIDVFIDMTLPPGSTAPILVTQAEGEVALARFVYDAGAPSRPAPLAAPEPLPANGLPARIDLRNALRIDVPLATAAPASPLFSVKRGRSVSLALVNRGEAPGVLHVHGHSVRLLDALDDGWKPFWLDTILVPGQQTVRVAFVADNPGKWMLETGLVGQLEGAGRATWFEVG